MGYRTIQQSIIATNDFDGTAPAGNVVRANDMEAYPAAAAGGLFNFDQDKPMPLKHIAFLGGGQTDWALVLVDVDNNEYPLLAGTNEAAVFERLDHVILLSGQKLKLTSAGATTAMIARITAATR